MQPSASNQPLRQTTRFAVIGAGRLFDEVNAAFTSGDHRIACGFDPNPAKSRSLEARSIQMFSSLDELTRSNAYDVAWVAVPNQYHFAVASKLLAAGKCVMLEKPAVLNMPDLETLFRLAQDNGGFLYVNAHAAFASEVIYFLQQRAQLERGLGELLSVKQEFYDPIVGSDGEESKIASLNGSWIDSGINALSVARRILDGDIKFRSASFSLDDRSNVETASEVKLFSGDLDIVINTDWTLGRNFKCTYLTYRGGAIELNHTDQKIIKTVKSEAPTVVYDGSYKGQRLVVHYTNCLDDFKACRRALNGHSDHSAFVRAYHGLYFEVNRAHPFFARN